MLICFNCFTVMIHGCIEYFDDTMEFIMNKAMLKRVGLQSWIVPFTGHFQLRSVWVFRVNCICSNH